MEQLDFDWVGVIWVSGIGGFCFLEEEIVYNVIIEIFCYNLFMILKMIVNMGVGYIFMKYGFCGFSYVIVLVCVFIGYVLGVVVDDICLGCIDVMVVGGLEVVVVEVGIGGFSVMKVMLICNDDFVIVFCFYDVECDGFVLGEGGGGFILEELEYVKVCGVIIYVELVGYVVSLDVYYIIVLYLEGFGVSVCMCNVLVFAGVNFEDVDYINIYGIFILLGDIVELKVIQYVFGEVVYDLNISLIKLMIGYLFGVVGVIEVIVCVLVIQYKFVLLMINYFNDDLEIDSCLNFIFNEVQEKDIKVVLSNIFGFGGYNFVVVFKCFEGQIIEWFICFGCERILWYV